jgi:hypothetical protein
MGLHSGAFASGVLDFMIWHGSLQGWDFGIWIVIADQRMCVDVEFIE